uniref:Thrombopoietin n=1 Tax=Hippocampus comes TaxID=109280 RepID=A0A3Q2XHW9_HIPCM
SLLHMIVSVFDNKRAGPLSYAGSKPIDFVCSRSARRAMNIVAEMQTALVSSTILPTPVQLPCTELHVASWERKSHHERRQDISASLRHLFESVKVARPIGQAECGSVLLLRLERNINSYLLILTHLQLSVRGCQGDIIAVAKSTNHSFCDLLVKCTQTVHYRRLITGKLERLMMSLESECTLQS